MTRRLSRCLFALLVLAAASPARAQDPAPPSGPPLQRVVVRNTTVYDTEDVAWLLHLRTGAPLAGTPDEVGRRLARLYAREGFSAATVAAEFDAATGTLTLTVDEGRIDDVQFRGATPELERRARAELERAGVRPGEPFNEPAARRAIRSVLAITNGAFRLGDIDLVQRNGRRVVLIPVRKRDRELDVTTGTGGREDLFSPVDGFAPALGFQGVVYDRSGFNYTLVSGFASWKFGRGDAGYSIGVERPFGAGTRLFVGTEMHDLTATDDRWRLTNTEQTIAALGVKRSFRDYYRRRGVQVFGGFRPSSRQELVASWRWDRHEPLQNETDFSLFRRGAEFRPNLAVDDANLAAIVLAYTFDSRGLDRAGITGKYERHLLDDLFRNVRRAGPGWRADWTSEIAGGALGGDHDFTRHILNVRAGMPLGPHQSLAARALVGWSAGTLPVERQFALGGLGSIHGHPFKAAAGEGMTLVNVEYALDLEGHAMDHPGAIRALAFFDAGRVRRPVRGPAGWMNGAGVGLQAGPLRVEWGFDLERGPSSGQLLVRLARGF